MSEPLESAIRKIVSFAISEGIAQPFENTTQNILSKPIDTNSENMASYYPMKRKPKPTTDAKITFVASPTDQAIIAAGLEKYGIRKMSEVLRMALKRFAEAEGLKVA